MTIPKDHKPIRRQSGYKEGKLELHKDRVARKPKRSTKRKGLTTNQKRKAAPPTFGYDAKAATRAKKARDIAKLTRKSTHGHKATGIGVRHYKHTISERGKRKRATKHR